MPASEQGVNLDRYMFVPRTLIIMTEDDKVLLLKGAADKRLWAGLYNGVGGHFESGEDIITAAQREVSEETGLINQKLWLCGIVTVDTQINPGVCIFVFKGEYLGEKLTSPREGALEWVKIGEITSIPLVSDLPWLLPKVMAHRPGTDIFIAHSKYDEKGNLMMQFL